MDREPDSVSSAGEGRLGHGGPRRSASGVVRPTLNEHLAGNVQAPPDVRLFTVLAAK
jgi:hypothetical protein